MKTSFLLILFFLINNNVLAQRATEITPNSITLPRLSTTEQNTVPPQQAGNIIYNADEKKLALHDGTNWNYLTSNPAASGFQKMRVFTFGQDTWTVPAGVTKIRVELWGGGEAGTPLNSIGAVFTCFGGKGACYALYELNVTPNENLIVVVGSGGSSSSGYLGYPSQIKRNSIIIASAHYYIYDSTPYDGLLNAVEGEFGQVADFSFQQVEASVFRKIVRTGAGGGTYPYFNNGGRSNTLEFTVPNGTLVGNTVLYTTYQGSEGGGGACANITVTNGSSGRIHIYY